MSQANRPPDAPFNLTVANAIATDGTVKLYWENVNGEKFYVYKNKNDGGFQFLDVTTNKYYKDTSGLSPDVKYGYYVTAVNGYGESQPSSKVYVYPTTSQSSAGVVKGLSVQLNEPPALPTITGYKTPAVNQDYIYWGYAKDKDSQSLTYTLDWGDGSPADQVTQKVGYNYRAKHAWANPGTYTITVTARDESGNSSSANTYQVKVR